MSSDAKKQTDKIPDETGKTYYERTIDALRLIGTGHAAGLLATGAALGAAIEKHVGMCPVIEVRGNLVRAWGDHFFLCVLLELSSLPGSGHAPTSIGAI